jgi:hypothetical protein
VRRQEKKFFASFFQERRIFFSEEKKQKTFALEERSCVAAVARPSPRTRENTYGRRPAECS